MTVYLGIKARVGMQAKAGWGSLGPPAQRCPLHRTIESEGVASARKATLEGQVEGTKKAAPKVSG